MHLKRISPTALIAFAAGMMFFSNASLMAQTPVPAGEPTNADEAAAKKAAEARELNAKFSAWKATLPEKQQAWETVLESNLGNFYLPLYQKDKIKTPPTPTAWDGSSLFRVGTEGATFSNSAEQRWAHACNKVAGLDAYGWTAFPSKAYKYGLPMGF